MIELKGGTILKGNNDVLPKSFSVLWPTLENSCQKGTFICWKQSLPIIICLGLLWTTNGTANTTQYRGILSKPTWK